MPLMGGIVTAFVRDLAKLDRPESSSDIAERLLKRHGYTICPNCGEREWLLHCCTRSLNQSDWERERSKSMREIMDKNIDLRTEVFIAITKGGTHER
jgi:hypothetical protein